MFFTRSSRYGLRGCRVGEASNPGPRVRRRRRVLSSVSRSDSNFSTLLDGMEEDLSVGAAVPVSSEAILEVQRSGTIRDSPEHELVQIDPTQRDSVQLLGATPVAVPRSVRDSKSDTDSVPGIDQMTRRRFSLVWRSQTADSFPEQNHAPDLSVSRARRPMQLVHPRSRMVSIRLATQATLVNNDMGDSFRDENVTPTRRHHARSVPVVRPRRCCVVAMQGGCGVPKSRSGSSFSRHTSICPGSISWVEWEQVRRVGVG